MGLAQSKKNHSSARSDLIWRLDDEFPSYEIEQRLLGERGYSDFVVSRSATYKEDYVKYAPYAKGISVAVSFPPLRAEDIKGLTSCKIICVTGGGYDHVDIEAATQRGIIVTYIPGYCVEEMSDHAMGFILALNQRFPVAQNMTRRGLWKATDIGPFRRLKGQVLGLVGFGRIGKAVARKAKCHGLQVRVFDPYVSDTEMHEVGAESVGFDDLVRISDFISLHVLLTKETYQMMNAEVFNSMKKTVYLINTCRGEVIDELALIEALKTKKIAGAGLDVLAKEPPDPQNPLLNMPNVIVTPHSAYFSDEARMENKVRSIKAITDAIEGRIPEDIVNPQVLNR